MRSRFCKRTIPLILRSADDSMPVVSEADQIDAILFAMYDFLFAAPEQFRECTQFTTAWTERDAACSAKGMCAGAWSHQPLAQL